MTETQAPEGALRAAAQAVLARWDSPLWRQEVGTAELMAALRAALAAPAPQEAPSMQDLAAGAHYPQVTAWTEPAPAIIYTAQTKEPTNDR